MKALADRVIFQTVVDSIIFHISRPHHNGREKRLLFNMSRERTSSSSLSDFMDSNEYEKDTRFASQVVEHHAKQRFESNNTQQRSKLRKISSSQLIKNRQAIKADINRKGLLLANQKIANQRSRNHIKTTRLADLADYCKFGKCLDRSITSRIIFWVVRRYWTNSKYQNGNQKTSRIWELYQSRDRCSRI